MDRTENGTGIITPMKRPTISDVARLCGLSKTTVSVILNEDAGLLGAAVHASGLSGADDSAPGRTFIS